MLTIIEGPDGTGKSTLVKQLCEKGFIEIKPFPRELRGQYELYEKLFSSEMYSHNKFIMDRSFISEWAYRIAVNDKEPNIRLIEIIKLLELNNVIVVYCNNKNAFENSIKRGETYIVDKSIHTKVFDTYNFIFNTLDKFTFSKIIRYDYERDDLISLIKEIGG